MIVTVLMTLGGPDPEAHDAAACALQGKMWIMILFS